jgi:hypothetical protein
MRRTVNRRTRWCMVSCGITDFVSFTVGFQNTGSIYSREHHSLLLPTRPSSVNSWYASLLCSTTTTTTSLFGVQHRRYRYPPGRTSVCYQPRRSVSSTTSLIRQSMALVTLNVDELERLISSSGKPTGAQYATYWGRTMKERYGRMVESATVGFLGVFFSYFLSFVVGGFVATILGSLFFFWGILSPELKAYQRNWEFLGGRQLVDFNIVQQRQMDPEHAGLYGGLFLGRIVDACVVEDTNDNADQEYDLADFDDYTMETDELDRYTGQPYLLRVRCSDRQGRTLQIHTRLTEDYLRIRPGIPATTLLLSTSPKFTKLAALTDVFVVSTDNDTEDKMGSCWIGDYPYLDRLELESFLAENDDLWDALQDEATSFEDETLVGESNFGRRNPFSDSDQNYSDLDYDRDEADWQKIRVRNKGRSRV